MKSRIIIVGAGGSGKDHLRQRFIDRGYKPSISYTTRPPRDGEIEGVDYYFINEGAFKYAIKQGEFFEFREFNSWYYGTSNVAFKSANLFIMTPPSIHKLSKEIRETSFIIYLDIPEHIRIKRLSDRKDADSVKRRVIADKEMFDWFVDYDLRISDPNF